MTATKVSPITTSEKAGAALFRLRGLPGILFVLALIFQVGPKFDEAYEIQSIAVGFLVMAAGEGIRLYSRCYIGRSSSTRVAKVSRLVTGGPYRLVRHPIYYGNTLIMVGFGIMSSLYVTTAYFLPFVIVVYGLVASYETRILLHNYPEEGQEYVRTISAWLPKPAPRGFPASEPVSMSEVFRREGKTVLYVLAGAVSIAAREYFDILQF